MLNASYWHRDVQRQICQCSVQSRHAQNLRILSNVSHNQLGTQWDQVLQALTPISVGVPCPSVISCYLAAMLCCAVQTSDKVHVPHRSNYDLRTQ